MTIIAALPHDTARLYARDARSVRLISDHNELLLSASEGEEVDVVEFRKAATAALSLASTRADKSRQRRDFASRARHLIYWADALIEQHIQDLPIYEPGARSPRIKELEDEVFGLRSHIENVEEQNARYVDHLNKTDQTLASYQQVAQNSETRLAEAQEKISNLETSLQEANADYVNATERADAHNAEVLDLADLLYVKDKRIASLEENTERLIEQRDHYLDEIQGLYSTLVYAEKVISEAQLKELNGYLAGFLKASGI